MLFFGLCFLTYFINLSGKNGFWSNLRSTDPMFCIMLFRALFPFLWYVLRLSRDYLAFETKDLNFENLEKYIL